MEETPLSLKKLCIMGTYIIYASSVSECNIANQDHGSKVLNSLYFS